MSFRSIVSIVTLVLIAVILYATRHEILKAWELLGTVNLWLLAVVIPLQIGAYFAAGEMLFSYLRQKGVTERIPVYKQASMALEMNFVNHTLPSGGVSGISYMTWRLKQFGVSPGKATAAQIVRLVAGFAAFILLLVVSLGFITLDGSINRVTILISGLITTVMVGGTIFLAFVIGDPVRIRKFSFAITRPINKFTRFITRNRVEILVRPSVVEHFFVEMHEEYITLRRERKLLKYPIWWGIVFTSLEVLVFVVVFWALGSFVSPAPVLIAYGLASIAGFIVITPGGAGAYEAIMVSFLVSAGVNPGIAIAGIILARVFILLITIGVGYAFYQHAVITHGKPNTSS